MELGAGRPRLTGGVALALLARPSSALAQRRAWPRRPPLGSNGVHGWLAYSRAIAHLAASPARRRAVQCTYGAARVAHGRGRAAAGAGPAHHSIPLGHAVRLAASCRRLGLRCPREDRVG